MFTIRIEWHAFEYIIYASIDDERKSLNYVSVNELESIDGF